MGSSKELETAISAAKQAGAVLLDYYNKNYSVFDKENNTPVTDADFASEKIICNILSKKFDYPILSEESVDDKKRLNSEFVWIVDPLDGTKDFIKKTSEFTIAIALAQNGVSVIGAVYRPLTSELYFAEKDKGAYLQKGNDSPEKLHVSNKIELIQSSFIMSEPKQLNIEAMDSLGIKNRTRVGSLVLKGCLIAQGKFDALFSFSFNTSEWDTCAFDVILREAGGIISDAFGDPIIYNKKEVGTKRCIVISNGLLHQEIIKKLSPFTSVFN